MSRLFSVQLFCLSFNAGPDPCRSWKLSHHSTWHKRAYPAAWLRASWFHSLIFCITFAFRSTLAQIPTGRENHHITPPDIREHIRQYSVHDFVRRDSTLTSFRPSLTAAYDTCASAVSRRIYHIGPNCLMLNKSGNSQDQSAGQHVSITAKTLILVRGLSILSIVKITQTAWHRSPCPTAFYLWFPSLLRQWYFRVCQNHYYCWSMPLDSSQCNVRSEIYNYTTSTKAEWMIRNLEVRCTSHTSILLSPFFVFRTLLTDPC